MFLTLFMHKKFILFYFSKHDKDMKKYCSDAVTPLKYISFMLTFLSLSMKLFFWHFCSYKNILTADNLIEIPIGNLIA